MNPGLFINGEPVPADYLPRVQALINDCCEAAETFGDDSLETYAAELANLEMTK